MLQDLLKEHTPRSTVEEILSREKDEAVNDLNHMIAAQEISYVNLRKILVRLMDHHNIENTPPTEGQCRTYIKNVRGTR